MTPDDARDAVSAPLVEMLGSAVRERIRGCLFTDWHDDPWALGSYAVARPGRAAARAALREPWSERVHYAGEAAAADGWHGTVAGAYLSGRAAARAVLARGTTVVGPVTIVVRYGNGGAEPEPRRPDGKEMHRSACAEGGGAARGGAAAERGAERRGRGGGCGVR